MTEEALEARRAYKREWQRNHRKECREQQERYWEKRAAEEKKKAEQVSRADAESKDETGD